MLTPEIPKSIENLNTGDTYEVDNTMPGTVLYVHDEEGNVTGTYTLGEWSDPSKGIIADDDVIITGEWKYTEKSNIPVDPEPGDSDDSVSVDKTATDLDANDQTTVTLKIGAGQGRLESNVVFVLDKSTSTDVREEAGKMLD